MAVAATTVKKPSENSPTKRASSRRCERKQKSQNHVRGTKRKNCQKTVKDTRMTLRHLPPLRPGAQNPSDTVQHSARVSRRSPFPIGPPLRLQDRFQQSPLRVADFPASMHGFVFSPIARSPAVCPRLRYPATPFPSSWLQRTLFETSSRLQRRR